MPSVYAFVVKTSDVKLVKTALEQAKLLSKHVKIQPYSMEDALKLSLVPILTTALEVMTYAEPLKDVEVVLEIGEQKHLTPLEHFNLSADVKKCIIKITMVETSQKQHRTLTDFESAMKSALDMLESNLLPCSKEDLLKVLPPSYSIYTPMLLLPFHCFRHEHWQGILSALSSDHEQHKIFFARLATKMNVTHIAINAIIPADNDASSDTDSSSTTENVLRSPTHLQPMHGDFGHSHPAYPSYVPSPTDFTTAFWVTTKQNGIHQTWAPRYTMFSAGNVTEKARLLTVPSMREAVATTSTLQGRQVQGCTAVDLFAGIGYFAFSYAKAGCSKVLCWDLNPWSIEGLRRGAGMNKWGCRVFDFEPQSSLSVAEQEEYFTEAASDPQVRLVAFRESNIEATARIDRIRQHIPPIRHVSCGTLPTIGEAWKTAVKALDSGLGGWIHLHETVPQKQVQVRAEVYRVMIETFATSLSDIDKNEKKEVEVILEHIETVKSMGPRLLHVVFDIWVSPRRQAFASRLT